MLSAFEDMGSVRPLSNRESGNGRYDIMVERQDVCIIFEFKACDEGEDPKTAAERALSQIEAKRYGAEAGVGKKLVKVGIGFSGKQCSVKAK
jgi:trehalose-6-phosphatase